MLRFLFFVAVMIIPFSVQAITVEDAVKLALNNDNTIKNKMSLMDARSFESKNAILLYFPSIGVSYGYNYYWDDLTKANRGKMDYDGSSAVFSANLNLFNGLYDMNAIGAAELAYNMADSELVSANQDVILNARLDFIGVLRAQSALKVAEENLQLLQLQKRDAQISADNGLIAKNDLLQVETYLASAELQRISARSSLVIAKQSLEKTINKPIDMTEKFVEPIIESVNVDNSTELKDDMFNNSSQIKYLEQSYMASQKSENMTKKSLYPRLDLKASYSAYGDDVWAWSGSPTSKDSAAAVGLTASWNVLDAFSGYFLARGKKKETQALAYTIADARQTMTLQLNTAIENYMTSKATLAQAKISVTSAEENYRVIKNQYDQSAATMTDLLNASVLLNQARMAESSATYDVISSVYQLERLLEKNLVATR